ncbi:prolipoprotein diacylglyceryl transferase [bacterium]|nr:prolipoprotein diacylglyceryl transferase [bacterium]
MHPILFSVGGFSVHSYGFVMAVAICVGVLYAMHIGKKRGLDPYDISYVGLWTVIIGLLGARFAYVAQHIDNYLQDPLLIMNFRRGGIAIQGALLFGFTATALSCKHYGIKMLNGMDVYMSPVLLGMAIGRIGCVMQGCCYGSPCSASLPWAITYPEALHIACVPRHPSQIYEALLDIALIFLVNWVFRRASFYGQAFWTGIAGYGVVRFITEFFRECDSAPVLVLTLAQWAAVLFIVLGVLGAMGKLGTPDKIAANESVK